MSTLRWDRHSPISFKRWQFN